MPNDRRANGKTATPFTPTLSTRFRATKTPLTPKLAGSAPSSPAVSPQHEVRHNFTPSVREGTPLLAGNVTPRSGARKSRLGTDSPATPSGGKARSRATSISETAKPSKGDGPVAPSVDVSSPTTRLLSSTRPKSAILGTTPSPVLTRRVSAAKSSLGNDRTVQAKFFHVDDLKATADAIRETERPCLRTGAASVGANNTSFDGTGQSHSIPDATDVSSQKKDDRFFHAGDVRLHSPSNSSPQPTLTKNASSPGLRSPRLQSPDLARQNRSTPRPPSPLKTASFKSAPVGSTPSPRSNISATTAPLNHARINSARRQSNGTNVSSTSCRGHQKSASTTSLGQVISASTRPFIATTHSQVEVSLSPRLAATLFATEKRLDPTSPETLSPRSTSLASSNTAMSLLTTTSASPTLLPTNHNISTTSESRPHKSTTDQASNARRERKVLDLEISNSSLLAINRTLEREIHKQSTALRRFRRLSKSGRLSMLTSNSIRTTSGQSSLGTLAEFGNEHDDNHDHDDQNSDTDSSTNPYSLDDDDREDIESSLSNDSLLSPSSRLAHSHRQRARDEKRLQLDLTKHRQLLVDSEKMSASLRRCLGYTDELIREANKALQYKVHVSDVELGGRVLVHHNEEEDESELTVKQPDGQDVFDKLRDNAANKPLLSPVLTMTGLEEAQLWVRTAGMQCPDGDEGMSPVLMPDR